MRKIATIIIVLSILLTALPAMPVFGQEEELPEATPTMPTEGQVEEVERNPWLEALDELDSYRYLLSITAEGALAEEMDGMANFSLEGAYTHDPQAIHLVMTVPEDTVAPEDMPCGKTRCEYIVVGEQGWLYDDEAETWTYDTTAPMIAGFIAPAFFLEMFLGAWPSDLAPEKEHGDLEGVDTSYYRWTPTPEELIEMELGEEGEVVDITVEVWIAADLNYPARALITIFGPEDQGKATIQIDVFDANTDIAIEPPEGAEAAPSSTELPTMPDAENVMPMGGMVIYETASSIEEVVDFYRQEMPAQGWSEDEESAFVAEDMVSLTFTKDSQEASILVSVEEGKTQVMIMTE